MKSILFLPVLIVFSLSFITGTAQSKEASASVNKIINNYLALKNALAAADGNLAEARAKELLSSVKEVPTAGLTDAQRNVYSKYAPKLEFDSRHISEVNRIPHQREHFASLSANLYAVLKELKINENVLYVQYCTMNKQTFLSETEKGKDPYMGMDNCSKVTATLAAVKRSRK